MAIRVFQQDVTVPAGAEVPVVQLDATIENLPRTLTAVGTDQNAAGVDLLVSIDDKQIVDRPSLTLNTQERKQLLANPLTAGQRTLATIRNGTGAGIPAQLWAEYELPD